MSLAAPACTSDGVDDAATTLPGPSSTGEPGDDGKLFTDADGDLLSGEAEAPPVVVSLDPVVETGVPGIDSDDVFCRAWSRYAGSVQALSVAWFTQAPAQAATLEVAAGSALHAAVDDMAANLPAQIESNGQQLTVDVPGPLLRRADRSAEFLAAAGADAATIDLLGDAWLAAITEFGLDSDDLEIVVPDGAAEPLATAAAEFGAAVPSILEDPTLDTTEFDIFPSLDYIADNCPDQGTLSGNDNVG